MKTIDFISNDLKLQIAESISAGVNTTISEIMEHYDLTQYQATELLSDTTFLTSVSKMSKAKAKLFFHSKGVSKLVEIADGENDKAALAAMKMIMEYTGEVVKKGGDVNVNVSLENHIREQEEKEKVVKAIDIIAEPRSLPSHVGSSVDDFDIDEISSNDLNFVGNNFINELVN